MKPILLIVVVFLTVGCTETRVKRYQDLLDPLVGSSNRTKVNALLGPPASCEKFEALEKCEYRTAAGRNGEIQAVSRPAPGYGPDVSPYESFDVLHVFYGDFGVVKEWQPIVVK